jgi:phosphoribosylpyrophosphate synthetase
MADESPVRDRIEDFQTDLLPNDDMVDSRWTMTVAAWLLRANGSGEVFPLALALTGHV